MKLPLKDIEHLLRLAALFVIGGLIFVVARHALVPKDFGEYGHYRGNALTEIRSRTPLYAGQAACNECHSDVFETRQASRHRVISCEACHGPLGAHAAGDENSHPTKLVTTALCSRCHAANTGKPKWYRTVDLKSHADDPCESCHKPHDPRME